jgi:F0F1-type ATP synthase assembly protein I
MRGPQEGVTAPQGVTADQCDRPTEPALASRQVVSGWLADISVAYISGIVLGAPLGLIALRVSGVPIALTIAIVVTMCAVLLYRRFLR